MARTSIAKLRRGILARKGLIPEPHTRRMRTMDELPDAWPKTALMKLLERKYQCKLELVLWQGSLRDVVDYFNSELDRSTVSKWRKYATEYLEKGG